MDQIVSNPEPPAPKKPSRKGRKLAAIAARKNRRIAEMRNHFQLELELGKKSLRRIKDTWEGICGRLAELELRDEIITLDSNVDKLLERKEEKIQHLLLRLEETYEMQTRSQAAYLDQLDYLSKCHRALRQSALDLLDMHTTDLVQDFISMVNEKQTQQDEYSRHFESTTFARNVVDKRRLQQNYDIFMDQKFDRVCFDVEYRYRLRESTVKKMRNLQDKLLFWIKDLEGDNLDANKNEKSMNHARRQRQLTKESVRLHESEKMCRRQIEELKKELLDVEIETSRELLNLQQEVGYFLDVKLTIKAFGDRSKLGTHERLLQDSYESHNTIKKLQEIVKKGELLLGMAATCRKFETRTEKIVPFKDEALLLDDDDNKFKITTLEMIKFFDISEEDLIDQMNLLHKFWYRSSKVSNHNRILKEDKKKLVEENEKYRKIIRSMNKSEDNGSITEALHVTPLNFGKISKNRS